MDKLHSKSDEFESNNEEPLKSMVTKIMDDYGQAKEATFAKHPLGNYFRKEVPQLIYQTGFVDAKDYLVSGSVGQGNWAAIPWICIFDRRITTSATRGVYIVYLLSEDSNSLYLTLNQGCTELKKSKGKRNAIQIMRENAEQIVSKIVNSYGFAKDGKINLGQELTELAELYQRGTIFYKEYQRENLPSESELQEDLSHMVTIYKEYAALLLEKEEAHEESSKHAWLLTWNPSNWEWKDYQNAVVMTHAGKRYTEEWSCVNTHVKVGDRVFLTMLGTRTNGIIASGFAITEGYASDHWDPDKAAEGQKTNYIQIEFDWIVDIQKENILLQDQLMQHFPEQKWNPQGSGITIKEDYLTELEQLWISVRLAGEKEMTIKETIAAIKNYILKKGFCYEDGVIENLYLSLKTKPFVILAGISGTGKTRLAKLFAEAIGATTTNGRYKMVPVRPDWSDSSDLFGHVDLNGKFVPGAIIDFVKQAEIDSAHPYFLCLDEMNLARVEYYFSDILSVIETRELEDGMIQSDPLLLRTNYGVDQVAADRYGIVKFPENLYLIGTVNMDETTFPFSRKVLDRANTIEFSYVDLMPNFDEYSGEAMHLSNEVLKANYLLLRHCVEEREDVNTYCVELQKINRILEKANAHIGYRVRDEIVFYLLNNKKYELLAENEAMDYQIMQKILPRIQGNSLLVKNMLCELFQLCAGDYEGYQVQSDHTSDKMIRALHDAHKEIKYRHSAEKIEMMTRRFEEDGFTSYWI